MGKYEVITNAIMGHREGFNYVILKNSRSEELVARIDEILPIHATSFQLSSDIEVRIIAAMQDCAQKYSKDYELIVDPVNKEDYDRCGDLLLIVKPLNESYKIRNFKLKYKK